ncbi:outer membrane protein assembly factor [Mucilaginibacter daejeonensis]|uniref:BamA/TamA family outer membrane protein n=1 Tax=Mucilaginibacter daejeonensis TaxID=398049 RepID=UPI001D177AA9|nr:BamA/TamA family outer membrane protein [Mucilaginibacter daejeonensis]UEG52404.1 outer membrane protein assembly factor [Mucilaginibacter daejeonensis]
MSLGFAQQLATAQSKPDSIVIRAGARYDSVGALHRILLGENYRKEWAAPVKVRVLDLSKEKGGLKIEQKGGGMQTKSLRLVDPTGHEWVLRSVQKFPERILPPALRAGLTKVIIDDQVTTGNPFAALTVPPMAEVLGVPHSNPEIVYIGDDPALGKYRKDLRNDVYLFEEREPLESEDTDNTHKVQKKLREDNDVRIDAKMALRARILDMIIGDWDRHDDQWRWDKDKSKKETVYTAVPRDRDQVYYKTSGILPWIVAHQWLKAKFQPFKPEIRDIKTWNLNGMYFDRYFLAEMDEKDWKEQIAYVQSHLTDEVITKAMHRMPPGVFAISGEELIRTVKARRDNMSKQGMDYYRFLSAQVDVAASAKNEQIKVALKDSGKVKLTISNIKKDNSVGRDVFERTFDPKVTKEVRVYGYGGGDRFKVTGSGSSPIKFRLVGAPGVDTFTVAKEVDDKRNLYIYDRSDEANVLPSRKQAKIHTAADTSVTYYDRKNYQYDRPQPIVFARYNNDYGVILTGGFAYTKYGFRKAPYDWRQELLVDYAFGRKSWRIHYNGDFKQAVGNNDIMIHFTSRGPDNISNFFGIGNNTVFQKDSEWIKFFRNRYDYLYGDARLAHTYGKVKLSAGVTGQYYHAYQGDNDNRYLQVYDKLNPGEQVFSNKTFAGLIAGAEIDTRNNLLMPTKGVYFETTVRGLQQLNQDNARYGQLLSEFSFYWDARRDSTFVLATRFGGGTTLGDPEFFQQLKLGGSDNLRGFRTWRFTGRSMLYNNVEARIKLFDFNSYLFPGRLGLIAFNDIGRVWSPGESSSQWHDGYGGGFYLIPAQLLLIQATLARSHEGKFVYVNLGYRF